ncbi:MAG: hypothetical protein N2045_14475, partial [Fimbriimonadales bacterium]|nr:hypothetical protein [Fimbriimonadales bacterium]
MASLASHPSYGSLAEKEQVISANRELLSHIRKLLEQPSWVTHIDVRVGDPTLDDYRLVAQLFAIEGKLLEQQGRYAQALRSYLDGLTFLEAISRGGDTLHLTFQFVSGVDIFSALPPVIPRLTASEALQGARRLERILQTEYPLSDLLTQEFRDQLQGWNRTCLLYT